MDILAAVVNQISWGLRSFDGCTTLQLAMQPKLLKSAFKGLKLTKERSFITCTWQFVDILMTS